MTGGPIEELVVAYDLQRVAERAERRRVLFRSRLIGLGVTLLVVIGFGIWFGTRGQSAGIGVSVLAVLVGVGWAGVSYLLYRRARAELAELRPGTAIRIDRTGVEVAGLSADWASVAEVSTAKAALGRSDRLVLRLTDGRSSSLALDQVTVPPATLDSTARAYSAGRHGVDLRALDN